MALITTFYNEQVVIGVFLFFAYEDCKFIVIEMSTLFCGSPYERMYDKLF